jgi:hypothetical protein
MRFEVVHRNHLCAASVLEGEKLVVDLQDLVSPLCKDTRGRTTPLLLTYT